MKPGRFINPAPNEEFGIAGRCARLLPGWPGCVMLRSIGRVVGEVAVDGGAEYVCDPRLPKLPPRPARASAAVKLNANVATIAAKASSGRKRNRSIGSSQETGWFG
jgi:hypothetical protein